MEEDLAGRRLSRLPLPRAPKKDWRYDQNEALRIVTSTAFICLGVGFVVGALVGFAVGSEALLRFFQ